MACITAFMNLLHREGVLHLQGVFTSLFISPGRNAALPALMRLCAGCKLEKLIHQMKQMGMNNLVRQGQLICWAAS